jgi:hypothetical protein
VSDVRSQATFTLDELLDAMRQGAADLSEYKTCPEWSEHWGVWERRMRVLIREGLKLGIVRRARTQRESIDGTMRWVPVYAFELKAPVAREGAE